MDPVRLTLLVLYLSSGLGATIFFLAYAFLIRWWVSEESINMMVFSGVIALSLDHSILRLALGEYYGYRVMQIVMIISIAFVIWWRLVLFIKLYWQGRRDREDLERVESRDTSN